MTRVPPSRVNSRVYRTQAALIAALTEQLSAQNIRFDTDFSGYNPVATRGRIGRRFFTFVFQFDRASLTIGSPIHREMASRAKHARRKALRALRRSDDVESLRGVYFLRRDLKRDTHLVRYPSRVVWSAVRNGVTGDPMAVSLEPEEAAELFVGMLSEVQLAGPSPKRNQFDAAIRRGSYTRPMPEHRTVIRKGSTRRRQP